MRLDFSDLKAIEKFPWNRYDLIVNCAGSIDYRNVPEAASKNITVNALAPISILSKLDKNQIYFHCSTHVVDLPASQQNIYSLSKALFENYVGIISDIKAKVVILRIPGIFSENRSSGIIYSVKKHYKERSPMTVDWTASTWHTMYLPRLIKIIMSLIKKDCSDRLVIIGYPVKTTIKNVLEAAEEAFGFSAPVHFRSNKANRYIPDISAQKRYVKITAQDFKDDLAVYFRK